MQTHLSFEVRVYLLKGCCQTCTTIHGYVSLLETGERNFGYSALAMIFYEKTSMLLLVMRQQQQQCQDDVFSFQHPPMMMMAKKTLLPSLMGDDAFFLKQECEGSRVVNLQCISIESFVLFSLKGGWKDRPV